MGHWLNNGSPYKVRYARREIPGVPPATFLYVTIPSAICAGITPPAGSSKVCHYPGGTPTDKYVMNFISLLLESCCLQLHIINYIAATVPCILNDISIDIMVNTACREE